MLTRPGGAIARTYQGPSPATTWLGLLSLLLAAFLVGVFQTEGHARDQGHARDHRAAKYKETGSFSIGNTADLLGAGIVRNEFAYQCDIPSTQGLDGYVIELPEKISSVESIATITGTDATGFYDLDMYFYDSKCRVIGAAAGETVPERGWMSRGTSYVVVSSTHGARVEFEFKAKEDR